MVKEMVKEEFSRISAIPFFSLFFFHLLSPFDGLLFLKRRNFRHRFRFIRGAVSRTGAKRNVEEDGEKVK